MISRPLFARNVFNEDTFTKTGMKVIKDTRSLQTIVARNSRSLRQVLADSVRHRVIDRNVADDPHTLVREDGPQRSFLEPF